jgi:hypothetical protein
MVLIPCVGYQWRRRRRKLQNHGEGSRSIEFSTWSFRKRSKLPCFQLVITAPYHSNIYSLGMNRSAFSRFDGFELGYRHVTPVRVSGRTHKTRRATMGGSIGAEESRSATDWFGGSLS